MMKTCLLLLAVPCVAFQQAPPLCSALRKRQDPGFNAPRTAAAAAALEEPPSVSSSELPPVLQEIVDERAEFQRNLGKAMDTLRKDYPEILKKAPDYSIYDDDICVVDPSGVQLSGLDTYKSSINIVQTLVSFLYNEQRSGLQFRIMYDFCRSTIRVSWHVVLYPKIFNRPLFLDGISIYKLNSASGKISEHRIENLLINNSPATPPYGIFGMVRAEMSPGVAVGGMAGV